MPSGLERFDAPPRLSLDPTRAHRTPLVALATTPALATSLAIVAGAIERHFPHNLFADLDRIAAELAGLEQRRGAASTIARAERIAHVHALFGDETPLRFRYTHDFTYGFDWARWVARDPSARADVGPYDDAFLAYSETRAAELASLIAGRDTKYGPLEGDTHRNPFPFLRDPESERVLHRALAAGDAIPVRAWSAEARDVWDRPFTALRERQASVLGLARTGAASEDAPR